MKLDGWMDNAKIGMIERLVRRLFERHAREQ
jgi:hypothetical protein